MSRKKKSRKPGANPAPVVVTRNRTEADVEGRLRKRLKKRKGQKSGSRHSDGSKAKQTGAAVKLDPRLGSKKKIPLIVEDKKNQASKNAAYRQSKSLICWKMMRSLMSCLIV